MLKKITLIAHLIAILGSYPSLANWDWQPSPRGFYTNQLINGVAYGITVFYSAADYHGPAGWRVAFDNQSFYNFGYASAELAVLAAVEIAHFYLGAGMGLPLIYQGVGRR